MSSSIGRKQNDLTGVETEIDRRLGLIIEHFSKRRGSLPEAEYIATFERGAVSRAGEVVKHLDNEIDNQIRDEIKHGQESEIAGQGKSNEQQTPAMKRRAEERLEQELEAERDKLKKSMVYLSLGGSDGSELLTAMAEGRFGIGYLAEYMPTAVAEAKAKEADLRRGVDREGEPIALRLFDWQTMHCEQGNIGDKFNDCLQQLKRWREEKNMTGLIISAQAVLHELPFRARCNPFPWAKLFSFYKGFQAKVFHSREPCLPTEGGWLQPVRVKIPHADPEQAVQALTVIKAHFLGGLDSAPEALRAHFKGDIYHCGEGIIEAPGPLVVEFLHKFLREMSPERFCHEMQECLSAFDPDEIVAHLRDIFGVSRVQLVYGTSGSFSGLYQKFGITATRASSSGGSFPDLGMPKCYCTITASRFEEIPNSAVPPSTNPPPASARYRRNPVKHVPGPPGSSEPATAAPGKPPDSPPNRPQ